MSYVLLGLLLCISIGEARLVSGYPATLPPLDIAKTEQNYLFGFFMLV